MSPLLTLLSRIEDILDIQGPGLVIIPGVPDSSRISVTVGDQIKLIQPDETIVNTSVSAIEIPHLSPPKTIISLRLGNELTIQDLPIGSELWIDAKTSATREYLFADVSCSRLAEELFTQDEAGQLLLANGACSIHTASTETLTRGALEFQFNMRSFLLSLTPTENGSLLTMGLPGKRPSESAFAEIEAFLNKTGLPNQKITEG